PQPGQTAWRDRSAATGTGNRPPHAGQLVGIGSSHFIAPEPSLAKRLFIAPAADAMSPLRAIGTAARSPDRPQDAATRAGMPQPSARCNPSAPLALLHLSRLALFFQLFSWTFCDNWYT